MKNGSQIQVIVDTVRSTLAVQRFNTMLCIHMFGNFAGMMPDPAKYAEDTMHHIAEDLRANMAIARSAEEKEEFGEALAYAEKMGEQIKMLVRSSYPANANKP